MIYKISGEGQTVFFESDVDKDAMEQLVEKYDSRHTMVSPRAFVFHMKDDGHRLTEVNQVDESNLTGEYKVDIKRWSENRRRITIVK